MTFISDTNIGRFSVGRAAISIHTKGQVSAQKVVEGIKNNNLIVVSNAANKQTIKQPCDVIWHSAPN